MSMTPYEQIINSGLCYLGPSGEAAPDVDDDPAGNWVSIGNTEGAIEVEHSGDLEFWRDDQTQGPRKATRPEEDLIVTATHIDITLETYARLISAVDNVATDSGPPAIKTLPHVRGFSPKEYALLIRGEASSPYGSFPGQHWIPRIVVDGSPSFMYGKNDRTELEVAYTALWDATQATGDEFGYLEVQTA